MTTTPARKDLHTAANALVDDMPRWRVLQVSTLGYRGALPEGVSEGDADEFRAAVKDIAICIAHGAVRVA
jgi:hypothetical protein